MLLFFLRIVFLYIFLLSLLFLGLSVTTGIIVRV